MPFIIVEGAENAGKTLFCKRVMQRLEQQKLKAEYRRVDAYAPMSELLEIVEEGRKTATVQVIEGWYLSTYVYSTLTVRKVDIDELDAISHINKLVDDVGVRLVLSPSTSDMLRRKTAKNLAINVITANNVFKTVGQLTGWEISTVVQWSAGDAIRKMMNRYDSANFNKAYLEGRW